MVDRDDKCLDGEGLETLWGLVKAHVTSALQGWDGRNTSTEGVHTSSITHVGTIAYGTWHGSAIEAAYIGSTAKGQLLYGNGSNVMALLGIGTAGQFLKVVDGAPAWSDLPVASGESESTLAGIVSTGTQSFAGQKTFKNTAHFSGYLYADSTLYCNDIYPSSNNAKNLGHQDAVFSWLYINHIVTPSGNGLRFGANNGDFKFYKSRVGWSASDLTFSIHNAGGVTVHRGNLNVSAGSAIISGNETVGGNVSVGGGISAGGIADLTIY